AEKLTIAYSTVFGKAMVTKHPTKDPSTVALTISSNIIFNIPEYIEADGVKFYPHKYEYINGDALYFMATPPDRAVTFLTSETPLYQKSQEQELTKGWLDIYDISGRSRFPDQNSVMGEGPVDHVSRYLKIQQDSRSWHWCHLIAHSMRPDSTAQVQ